MLAQPKGRESIMNEIDILLEFNHKNVVQVFEIYESKNSLYFVIEYLAGGSLNDFLRRSKEFISVPNILIIVK